MVEGLTSSMAAARGTLPAVSLRASRMNCRSIRHSGRTVGAGSVSGPAGGVGDDNGDAGAASVYASPTNPSGVGNISGVINSPSLSTTALRTTFCSWRTLPGQW